MKKQYTLMNQETEVLKFEFDEELNVITEIKEIYNINYAPLEIKNTANILLEINNWFNNRAIPLYRDNAKEILEIFRIDSTKELINRDYALSLSDQYWFKPEDEKIEWRNINYFQKDYNSVSFAEATYGRGSGEFLKQSQKKTQDKTPNNTSNGQLKKVWIKKQNENYLYKGAGTIHNFEPINEVLASKICEILEVPHVKYTLDVVHSKRQDTLVSICKCAINPDEEIITASSILTEEAKNITKTIKDFEIYVKILEKHNVPKARENLEKMFMLDYIMLNEDRHLNNFGIIRNVKTLEWVRTCPIFDTGRSMNTNVTTAYWNFEEGEVKCFTQELISSKLLENLFTIKIEKSQIDKLKLLKKEYKEMLEKYQEYTKLSNEEIKKLVKGYTQRIEIIEKIYLLKS